MENYTELKTSRQTAADLVHVLDKQYSFIGTDKPQYKQQQAAYYMGMLAATELLFAVTVDEQHKHTIQPYPMG